MPIPADPGDSGLIDLTIELAVEFGQTKTVHRIKKGGTLKVKNHSPDKLLTIASPAPEPPFVLEGSTSAVSSFDVDPRDTETVTISEAYDVGESFTYTAQIEGSQPEDPIVIIERR